MALSLLNFGYTWIVKETLIYPELSSQIVNYKKWPSWEMAKKNLLHIMTLMVFLVAWNDWNWKNKRINAKSSSESSVISLTFAIILLSTTGVGRYNYFACSRWAQKTGNKETFITDAKVEAPYRQKLFRHK